MHAKKYERTLVASIRSQLYTNPYQHTLSIKPETLKKQSRSKMLSLQQGLL
jgi:hypothetical protein